MTIDRLNRVCLVIALVGLAGPAAAQDPERTTATYGQWELRCENRTLLAGNPTRACEIVHAIQIQGQLQPIAQVAIGRGGIDAPLRMVFQVPIAVWLPAGLRFRVAEDEVSAHATYKRCIPTACLADIEAIDGIVAAMRDGASTQGNLEFESQEGQPIAVPIGYAGFRSAFDALMAAEQPQ